MPIKTDDTRDDYYAQVQSANGGTSSSQDKKPLKLKLKAVVKKPNSEEVSEDKEEKREEVQEKPKARLVEREHASEGLLRSVMSTNKKDGERSQSSPPEKKPAISFGKPGASFKPLENRPVMRLPREDRPRRPQNDTSRPSTSSPQNSEKRIRDDVKPMFQRDIGFSTPNRDGTAKKAGKSKKQAYDEAENKRR
jgi:hypothetical protein